MERLEAGGDQLPGDTPSIASVLNRSITSRPDEEEEVEYDGEEEDLLRITPEIVAVAATFPGRDLGVDYEAGHQWRLEEDWEYARQNEDQRPVLEEVSRRWPAQIEARSREELEPHEKGRISELRPEVRDL
jgi:hypothetical protein